MAVDVNPLNAASLAFKTVWKWDITYFYLAFQRITFEEFKILTKRIGQFNACNLVVHRPDGTYLSFEELLANVSSTVSSIRWLTNLANYPDNTPLLFANKLYDERHIGYKNMTYHFYGSKFPKLLRRYSPLYQNRTFRITICFSKKDIEAELRCPSNRLEETLNYYDYFSCSPISKKCIQNYRELKSMYDEIVEAENNWKKWFELITQIEDFEYVCQNIDHRLGKDLNNIDLWKQYFGYLEEKRSTEKLLHLYSRYCRYFLDDKEMKMEYEKAAKKYGPPSIQWKNPFEFEEFQEKTFDFPSADIQYPEFPSPTEKFSIKEGYHRQIFSLPKTNMTYIMDTVKPEILHKLHQTCKYFFVSNPHPVCHGIWNCGSGYRKFGIWFREQSLGILQCSNGSTKNIYFDRKIILSHSFASEWASKRIFSHFISSNIFECHIKFLQLSDQDLTAKDYHILVKAGNIEKLMFYMVSIGAEIGTPFTLEMILEPLPKIIEFQIWAPIITPDTFEKLLQVNFVNKFQLVHLNLMRFIEPYGFCEFVKKNFVPETKFDGFFLPDLINCQEMVDNARKVAMKELGHIYNFHKDGCHGCSSHFNFH